MTGTDHTIVGALDARYHPKTPWVIRATDQAGIRGALEAATARISPIIPGALWDPTGTVTIELPPGDLTIRDAHGLLGVENLGRKITGLRFVGAGKSRTRVIFDPTEPAHTTLAFNDRWLGLWFEGITFVTKRPGATFMDSYTTHNAQAYTFTDVAWVGPWRHVFDLKGDNNNSEFLFTGCDTMFMEAGGSFLHIGAEGTSDQFLNYWFYGFKHWSTSASLIDMARGGHVHLFGVDVSDWGKHLTAPGYLLNLRGHSHAQGVTTLTAQGLRVEAKSPHAGLLHSEWPSGNVNIQVDWSSQVPYYNYGDVISIDTGNTPGAVYHFHDSNLAGGVRVAYGVNAWEHQHAIRFANCGWAQRLTPSEVVTYTDPAANRIRPAVTFEGCRGEAGNPFSKTGASVWDATISHAAGALVKAGTPRSLTVRSVNGSVGDGVPLRVNLPVGAFVTGVTSVGASGSWAVETSTGEPICDTSATGSPFLCDTRERATITVRESTGARTQSGGFLTIAGYW